MIKIEISDKEFKRCQRDMTHGLKGEVRRGQLLWMQALRKVGAPVWARYGSYPGPREIVELRDQLADDPDLLGIFEESFRQGSIEFAARLGSVERAEAYLRRLGFIS
jgi:hypothetical protein